LLQHPLFYNPKPGIQFSWKKDFCLPDEDTTQRKSGEKEDGRWRWTVEVDDRGTKKRKKNVWTKKEKKRKERKENGLGEVLI